MQTTEKIKLNGKTYELKVMDHKLNSICGSCDLNHETKCRTKTKDLCAIPGNYLKHWKEVKPKPKPKHTTTNKIIIAVATIIGVCYAATMVYYFIKTF